MLNVRLTPIVINPEVVGLSSVHVTDFGIEIDRIEDFVGEISARENVVDEDVPNKLRRVGLGNSCNTNCAKN